MQQNTWSCHIVTPLNISQTILYNLNPWTTWCCCIPQYDTTCHKRPDGVTYDTIQDFPHFFLNFKGFRTNFYLKVRLLRSNWEYLHEFLQEWHDGGIILSYIIPFMTPSSFLRCVAWTFPFVSFMRPISTVLNVSLQNNLLL